MAALDPALQQELARLAADMGQVAAGFSRLASSSNGTAAAVSQVGNRMTQSLSNVGTGMNRLRTDIDRGRTGYREAAQSLRYLQQEFDDLDETLKQSNAGTAIRDQQTLMAKQIFVRGLSELTADVAKVGLGGVLTYYKNQVLTNIKSVQDNAGGMQTAFNLQNQALRDQIDTLGKLSQGTMAAAGALALIPHPFARIATAAAGGASLLLDFSKNLKTNIAEGLIILQTELIKTTESFKVVTSAGATFTNDVMGMRDAAADTGLDLKDFATMISQNSDSLAAFGGSVGNGTKRFVDVNKNLDTYRRGLLNLGYTTEEQAQATIDYMDLLRSAGQLGKYNEEQIAKGTADYLTNLRAVSAFTGEDAKKAQARAREAGQQLAVQSKLMAKGPEALAAFEASIRNMDPIMQKAMQQGVAFDGTIVDESLSQLFAMSPSRKALFDKTYADFAAGLSPEQITANYQQNLKELGGAMAKEASGMGSSVGVLNLATNGLSELTKMLQDTVTLGLKGVESLKNPDVKPTTDAMEELRGKTQGLVDEFSKVTEAFINSRRTLTRGLSPYIETYVTKGLPGVYGGKTPYETVTESDELTSKALRAIGIIIDRFGLDTPQPPPDNRSNNQRAADNTMPMPASGARPNPRTGQPPPSPESNAGANTDNVSWLPDFFNQSTRTPMRVIVDQDNRLASATPTGAQLANTITRTQPVGENTEQIQTVKLAEPAMVALQNTDVFAQALGNKFNESFAATMASINAQNLASQTDKRVTFDNVQLAEVFKTSFESALNNPSEITRSLDAVKTQIAEGNREQLLALQAQQDKVNNVEVAIRDNIRVNEDIMRTLA